MIDASFCALVELFLKNRTIILMFPSIQILKIGDTAPLTKGCLGQDLQIKDEIRKLNSVSSPYRNVCQVYYRL